MKPRATFDDDDFKTVAQMKKTLAGLPGEVQLLACSNPIRTRGGVGKVIQRGWIWRVTVMLAVSA